MTAAGPTVTVVIPTHNRRDLIQETIQSVLAQTFVDFEIIVVDNGSTDDTGEVVRGTGDPRVRYIFQENTGGPAGPRNTGIEHAQGKYLCFLDSDDLWLHEKLQYQVDYLERESAGLVYCQCTTFKDAAHVFDEILPSAEVAKSGRIFDDLVLSCNFIPCLTVMVRRATLEQVGHFDEDPKLKTVEDFDLWLRIARVSEIGFIPRVLSMYRVHPEGLSMSSFEQWKATNCVLDRHEERGWIDSRLAGLVRSKVYWQMVIQAQATGRQEEVLPSMRRAFISHPSCGNALRFFYYLLPWPFRSWLRSMSY